MVESNQKRSFERCWVRTVGTPCISLISCCPFECLQTVYKPLVTSQPFAEVHLSLTSSHSSQTEKKTMPTLIRSSCWYFTLGHTCLPEVERVCLFSTETWWIYGFIYVNLRSSPINFPNIVMLMIWSYEVPCRLQQSLDWLWASVSLIIGTFILVAM